MNLNKCLLVNNNCYKTNRKITVKGLMIHSTGANNPNLKRYVQPDDGKLGKNVNGNDWNQPLPGGREVCVHGFIGKLQNGEIATYQTLEWDTEGWHAGGSANKTHIGVEVCEDDLTNKDYFNKVYKEATELFAKLCKMYNLNPLTNIISHKEGFEKGIASNHSDIDSWFNKFGKTMNDFRNDVNALVVGNVNIESPESGNGNENNSSNTNYLVKINTSELNVRDGAGTSFKINTTVNKNEVYTIIEEKINGNTKWGKLKSGAGWISLMFTEKINNLDNTNNEKFLTNSSYTGTSIIDALKQINVDSSYEYRSKLAKKNGIVNYTGKAEENNKLLNLLKSGKLME